MAIDQGVTVRITWKLESSLWSVVKNEPTIVSISLDLNFKHHREKEREKTRPYSSASQLHKMIVRLGFHPFFCNFPSLWATYIVNETRLDWQLWYYYTTWLSFYVLRVPKPLVKLQFHYLDQQHRMSTHLDDYPESQIYKIFQFILLQLKKKSNSFVDDI